MTADQRTECEPVRLLFEMTRDDNPRLYDDLVRFNKGTKRVNRLRFLAHEGLMAQYWMASASVANESPPVRGSMPAPVASAVARQTNQAFEAPSGEEGT